MFYRKWRTSTQNLRVLNGYTVYWYDISLVNCNQVQTNEYFNISNQILETLPSKMAVQMWEEEQLYRVCDIGAIAIPSLTAIITNQNRMEVGQRPRCTCQKMNKLVFVGTFTCTFFWYVWYWSFIDSVELLWHILCMHTCMNTSVYAYIQAFILTYAARAWHLPGDEWLPVDFPWPGSRVIVGAIGAPYCWLFLVIVEHYIPFLITFAYYVLLLLLNQPQQ